jgi:hypothetical protein
MVSDDLKCYVEVGLKELKRGSEKTNCILTDADVLYGDPWVDLGHFGMRTSKWHFGMRNDDDYLLDECVERSFYF